jgi:DNA-binding CsgD family transcriptional regulator
MTFGTCLAVRQRATVAVCEGRVAVSSGAVAGDPSHRLPRRRSRSVAGYAVALLVVATAVVILEMAIPVDHGSHLLVALALVLGAALKVGTGPAATALAVGAGLSVVVAVVRADAVLHGPLGYLQLVAYLGIGVVVILVMANAHRSRLPAVAAGASGILPPTPSALVEPLTAREKEILVLAASGISVVEIADRLCVSPNTVKTHLTHIYGKLGARGRTDAVRAAIHCGCLRAEDICPHLAAMGLEGSPVPVTPNQPNR